MEVSTMRAATMKTTAPETSAAINIIRNEVHGEWNNGTTHISKPTTIVRRLFPVEP
jgi:hypothetical protein